MSGLQPQTQREWIAFFYGQWMQTWFDGEDEQALRAQIETTIRDIDRAVMSRQEGTVGDTVRLDAALAMEAFIDAQRKRSA